MALTSLRYVTLDIGNTLYYDDETKLEPIEKTLQRYGLVYEKPPPTPKKLLSMYGIPVNDTCELSLEAAAMLYVALAGEKPTYSRVREIYFVLIERLLEIATPYPATRNVLEWLIGKGYRLAVISNATTHERVVMLLERDGLAKYFDAVVTSRLVGFKKPHPAIFKYTLSLLGAKPSETLHVGDKHYEDMYGAKNLGMKAIHVSGNEKPSSYADKVIRNIEDLPDAIMSI